MEKKIEFKNIFIISFMLGFKVVVKIVFAASKDKAIEVIEDYYVDYNINYIFSFEEINQLLEESYLEHELSFYLCVIIKENSIGEKEYDTFYERVKNVEELKEKYKEHICLFLNKENFLVIAKNAEELIKDKANIPLKSEEYLI